jgi:ABC-type polysaccharide/polyol phosphate transport system ATPase subunit
MGESETLVRIDGLGKKFCRRLKRSLWYGVRDIGAELLGSKRSNVKLRKEEFWALQDVNFEIKRGELVGLIGANGAGKTTLLKLLSGLIKPDRGEVTVRGKIQALIALGAGFNPILTARENIYINGAVLGFSKKEMDRLLDRIMDFAEISEFIDMPVQNYSSGMQVRLGFAIAVNLKPDILIVDEVLAVGDAAFRRKARNKMMELLHSGISVLFVSHNMALVSSLTSRCIYLDKGRVVTVGASDKVTSLYLSDSIRRSKESQGQVEEQEDYLMASAYLTAPGVFVLKAFSIRGDSGAEAHEFNTYDNIHIVFEILFLAPTGQVMLAFNIREQVDDVVISSSKMVTESHPVEGLVRGECEIKENKLREGNYNIGFYAMDEKGGALYKSHQVGSFTILADMDIIGKGDSSQGFMVMDTHWNILA